MDHDTPRTRKEHKKSAKDKKFGAERLGTARGTRIAEANQQKATQHQDKKPPKKK
jgi:ribosome assembly protein YihI (activator of Der GTPase)